MNLHQPKIKNISLSVIEDPLVPIRSTMDEERLIQLGESIKKVGLIQPITVMKTARNYEVVAGHRRFKAAQLAGLDVIPCIIVETNRAQSNVLKIHENFFREDINPVDEALHIAKSIESSHMTVVEFAKMINRSETYVKNRLYILEFDPIIKAALRAKKIILVAAMWLNKIGNPNLRRDYLDFAVRGGVTGHQAQAWYVSWKSHKLPAKPEESKVVDPKTHKSTEVFSVECELCGAKCPVDHARLFYAHPECMEKIREVRLKR